MTPADILDGWPDVADQPAAWVVVALGVGDAKTAVVFCDLSILLDSDDARDSVAQEAADAIEREDRPTGALRLLEGWPEWCGHGVEWVVVVAIVGGDEDTDPAAVVYASTDGVPWHDVQDLAAEAARSWEPDASAWWAVTAEA